MLTSLLQSGWTVLVTAIFIGIVIWAYSPGRKKEFEEAGNIPFEDSDDGFPDTSEKEHRNG